MKGCDELLGLQDTITIFLKYSDRIKAGESGFCATVLTEEQIEKKMW